MKYVLNEGLARWQLATDTTLLEGVSDHIGRWAILLFLIYLLPFTFVVGGALITATGVATHAIVGWPADPETATLVWGGIGSVAATLLVLLGSFTLFERVMACGIVIMFVAVCLTALLLGPDWGSAARGLVPGHPGDGEALDWTVALVGGVGGTVTVLCYGYWMRQAGRSGTGFIPTCRIDLLVAYVFTALFDRHAGDRQRHRSRGARHRTADRPVRQLHTVLGPIGAVVFLIGACGHRRQPARSLAVDSLLFTDAVRSLWGLPHVSEQLGSARIYRVFLLLLATVPMLQVGIGFAAVQKAYAVLGRSSAHACRRIQFSTVGAHWWAPEEQSVDRHPVDLCLAFFTGGDGEDRRPVITVDPGSQPGILADPYPRMQKKIGQEHQSKGCSDSTSESLRNPIGMRIGDHVHEQDHEEQYPPHGLAGQLRQKKMFTIGISPSIPGIPPFSNIFQMPMSRMIRRIT